MDAVIGYKIRKIREIKNLSQKYMADKLSIHQNQYSDIETCKTQISNDKLEEITHILEIELNTIKNFNNQIVFNTCSQSGYYNSNTIYPIEKIEELYKYIIKVKDDQIMLLKKEIEYLRKKD